MDGARPSISHGLTGLAPEESVSPDGRELMGRLRYVVCPNCWACCGPTR